MTHDEIRSNVSELLDQWNIQINVKLIGETIKEGWQCDQWKVSIGSFSFDYYTGVGLRNKKKNAIPAPNCGKNTIAYVEWGKYNIIPVIPHSADLLYGILLDSESAETSFNNWCDNYGCSNDSISAFNIYQKCCEYSKELRKVFSRSQIDALKEIFQEY